MVERIQRGSETLSYISSPEGLVAMHISDDAGRDEMKYVLTDYLGTIYALVDNGAQSTEDALYYSFNAWGERRELQAYDGSLTAPLFSDPADYITSRGYTGHEHIDAFDLINLNGRAYDPVVGAFLSPDPYVQAPDMPQNLNRYAYCLNNPLKYTDPSGNFIMTIMFGMMANVMIQGLSGNMNTMGSFFLAAGIGGAAAGVGLATGSIFLGAFFGQTGNSLVNGNNFGQSVLAGLQAGATSVAVAAGLQLISSGAQSAYKAIAKKIKFNRIAKQTYETPMPKEFGPEMGITDTKSLQQGATELIPEWKDNVESGLFIADDSRMTDNLAGYGYSVNKNGDLVSQDGEIIGGVTIPVENYNGDIHARVFISRTAAEHQWSFQWTLAHEVTHAYHIKTGLIELFGGASKTVTEYFAHELSRAMMHETNHTFRLPKNLLSKWNSVTREFNGIKVYPPTIDKWGLWKRFKFHQ